MLLMFKDFSALLEMTKAQKPYKKCKIV